MTENGNHLPRVADKQTSAHDDRAALVGQVDRLERLAAEISTDLAGLIRELNRQRHATWHEECRPVARARWHTHADRPRPPRPHRHR